MRQDLTSQQKETILDNELGKTVTISLGLGLHADLFALYLKDTARYSHSFSAFIRDAMMCFLANGVDWRVNKSDNGKLDEILRAIQSQQVTRPDRIKEETSQQALDTTAGFFVE